MATLQKYNEKFRPQFHFTPEANWMNDPNGMVFYEGEYHLFYQHFPGGTTWGPMHWGHAVSRDLVHWEHLPIALEPDDNGYIFSGSAVVDWRDTSGLFDGGSGLVAIFTHHDTDPSTGQPRQRQSIAYSRDKGRTWLKYEGNPVLSEPSVVDFRDPKVFWHRETSSWVMTLAAGDHVRFYRSPNLLSWTFASAFGAEDGSHDGVWECPDLIELPVDGEPSDKRWALIVSIGDNPDCPEGSRTQYFVGAFDGYRFANENPPELTLWLDYGRDNYAGVTWSDIPDADGRTLFVGWMSNWKYANATPTSGWRSAMTIPRELGLYAGKEGVRLKQRPVQELERLRADRKQWRDVGVTPLQPFAVGLEQQTVELRIELSIGNAERIDVTFAWAGRQAVVVGYDVKRRALYADRTASGAVDFHPQFACRHEAPLEPRDGRVALHFFLDRSSLELFAGDGELAMTDLLFPDAELEGLEVAAVGGEAKIVAMELYRLRSIHASAEAKLASGTEG